MSTERITTSGYRDGYFYTAMATGSSVKNKIKEYRKAKGLTLEILASKAGISKGGLCDIQNGKVCPSIETAYKIAVALDKTVYEVFPIPAKQGEVM